MWTRLGWAGISVCGFLFCFVTWFAYARWSRIRILMADGLYHLLASYGWILDIAIEMEWKSQWQCNASARLQEDSIVHVSNN